MWLFVLALNCQKLTNEQLDCSYQGTPSLEPKLILEIENIEILLINCLYLVS